MDCIKDLLNPQQIFYLQEELIEQVLSKASEEILTNKIIPANEIQSIERISVGCKSIDSILMGGIPINGITELYGSSGVGKTQFSLQLSINIQLPTELGGKEKGVIYICTENTFPFKRFNELGRTLNKKFDLNMKYENNIHVKLITESEEFQKCIEYQLIQLLSTKNIGLIIIDSIAGIYRNETRNYMKRSKELTLITKKLNKLQDQFNCAVLVINQVTDNLKERISEPSLGLSWSNNITNRFYLKKDSTALRRFETIFSPDLPNKSCQIKITTEGLVDV